MKATWSERTWASCSVLAQFGHCLLLSHTIDYSATFCPEYFLITYSLSCFVRHLESGYPCQNLAGTLAGFIDLALILHSVWCFEHRQHATYSPHKKHSHVGRPRSSNLAGYMLKICDLCDLRAATTGERAALIKRIDEARQNTSILSGTPPPIQDGGEHMANQNALEMPFQELQRQAQELLDWESRTCCPD